MNYASYKLMTEREMSKHGWLKIAQGLEQCPIRNLFTKNDQHTEWKARDYSLRDYLIKTMPIEWKCKLKDVNGGGFEYWQTFLNEFEDRPPKDNLLNALHFVKQRESEHFSSYVDRIVYILNELSLLGKHISNAEKVKCFLNGLLANYKPDDCDVLIEAQICFETVVSMVNEFYEQKKLTEQSLAGAKEIINSVNTLNNDVGSKHSNETLGLNSNPASVRDSDTSVAFPVDNTASGNISNIHRTAFETTNQHKGLHNGIGENNCFLNVTIQALWHLGPFRTQLKQFIAACYTNGSSASSAEKHSQKQQQQLNIPSGGLLECLYGLFVQYEFTDEQVLPPLELRLALGRISSKFQLGKIADANEAFDAILQHIHTELNEFCPHQHKCLSHEVFGGSVMEQAVCNKCGASSEPSLRSDFILCFNAAELLCEAEKLYVRNISTTNDDSSAVLNNYDTSSPLSTIGNEVSRRNITSSSNNSSSSNGLFKPIPPSKLSPKRSSHSIAAMTTAGGITNIMGFRFNNGKSALSNNVVLSSSSCDSKSPPGANRNNNSISNNNNSSNNNFTYDLQRYFGQLLHTCMGVSQRSCPSSDASPPHFSKTKNITTTAAATAQDNETNKFLLPTVHQQCYINTSKSSDDCKRDCCCDGRATVLMYSLDPPLALALSIGWAQPTETAATLTQFYALVSYSIKLSDLFNVGIDGNADIATTNNNRVNVYGKHLPPTDQQQQSYVDNKQSNDIKNHQQLHLPQISINYKNSNNDNKKNRCNDNNNCNFKSSNHVSATSNSDAATAAIPDSNPSYVFRGLVCYYGLHYVSIFQSNSNAAIEMKKSYSQRQFQNHQMIQQQSESTKYSEAQEFLLFDDQHIKPIGDWEAVKVKCIRSLYQPVLLLYELEK